MRLSSRLPTSFEPNALSSLLAARRRAGMPILDLTPSNPTTCGFSYPENEIRAALSVPSVLRYAPDSRGSREARAAVARHHGHGLEADDLLLTASTSEGYSLLFKLLGDPGDDVLVPSPSYPLFEWLARLEGLQARTIPSYFHDRWHLDLGALELSLTARTKAVVVVNPNNPTGHFLSRSEWERLTRFCADRGLAVLVDEVFADYALERPPEALPTILEAPRPPCPTFLLSGLSKIAALPQVKLGWIATLGPEAPAHLEALSFLADQYLSVSASAQAGAASLLALAPGVQSQVRKRLRANLGTLDRHLADHPRLSRLPVEGGWSVLLRRPAVEADDACAFRLLQDAEVLVHPGSFFDLPGDGHVVLSLLTPEATFSEGLARALPRL